ncbi:hypothetical protein BJF88_11950 [Cellulosimicrobium sp. CUA-896]|nr:hypothetical protein BJF88_11950 [Cellulosimicrobium sp. CUA-896]
MIAATAAQRSSTSARVSTSTARSASRRSAPSRPASHRPSTSAPMKESPAPTVSTTSTCGATTRCCPPGVSATRPRPRA